MIVTFKVIYLFISIQQVTSILRQYMLCNAGSGLDDVDNEDGGSVCARMGFHHAARERSDTCKPLWEGHLLLVPLKCFRSSKRILKSVNQIHSVFGKTISWKYISCRNARIKSRPMNLVLLQYSYLSFVARTFSSYITWSVFTVQQAMGIYICIYNI